MAGRPLAIASLLLVMLIWGTGFVATKAVLVEVPPLALAFLRFALAAAILLALARTRGASASLSRPLPFGTLALMGLTGVAVFIACYNVGLLYTTALDAGLIFGASPAITAAMAAGLLGERPTRIGAVGIGMSVLGAALVVLASGRGSEAPNPLLGDLLVFASVIAWGIFTILGKRLQHVPQLSVTACSSLLGALFLLLPAAFETAGRLPAPSASSWAGIIYLGVAPSALCYLLWNRALGVLGAGQASTFLNLIPVIAVASAVLLLGETLAVGHVAGGALVLAGVWLSSRPPTASFDSPVERG